MRESVSISEPLAVIAYIAAESGTHNPAIGGGRPTVTSKGKQVRETKPTGKRPLAWFGEKNRERALGEHSVSGVPTGTQVLRNPAWREVETAVGFPEESAIIERRGQRFHLIQGYERNAIEVARLVERRENRRPDLVEDRTVYVLAPGTSLDEAHRISYDLLEEN